MTTQRTENDHPLQEQAAKPPFLRRVQIRNYKSIEFCDVTLEPLTILIGRNGSGKSNFLDALAFLRDVVSQGAIEAVRMHGGGRNVLSRTSTNSKLSVEIEAEYVDLKSQGIVLAQFGFELNLADTRFPIISREFLKLQVPGADQEAGFHRTQDGVTWLGKAPSSENPFPPERLFFSYYNHFAFDFYIALMEISIHDFVPDRIRRLQSPMAGVVLDRSGHNLASVVADIQGDSPAIWKRITSYLRYIVEEIESFQSVRYGEWETVSFELRTPGSDRTLEFNAASMSDGTLRILAALVACYQERLFRRLVGIEEPETSLHPGAVRALVDALDEATLQTQVLLTTHSTELLDHPTIRPENIRVAQMIDGKTVIAPVDEASVEIVRQELDTLGSLERQDLLQPDFADLERQQQLFQKDEGPAE